MRTRVSSLREACRRPAPGAARRLRNAASRRKILLALLLLPACSWSSFDELADETWVDSVGAAEGVDPNDFVGLASPGESQANAVFVVLGRATDSVGGYTYDADGSRSSVGVDIRGGATQFGPLGPGVVMAGDPYSNHVGVAGVTGAANDGDTKVVHFEADNVASIVSMNDFNDPTGLGTLDGPIHATGIAYARTDDDDATASTTDVLLARGNQLAMVQNYAADAHTLIGCLPDASDEIVMTVGAGPFDPADVDDEIILVTNDASGTAPQIVILDGSTVAAAWAANGQALGGCFDGTTRNPIARIDGPAGDAGFGGKMVVADFDGDGFVDFAVSSPSQNRVVAYMNDGNLADGLTGVEVDATLDASMFGSSLAAGELDGLPGDELVIGAPQSNIEGASNAGAVHVFVRGDTGSFTRAMTVHDAQPEAEQRVGQAVAVVPWAAGGANVLVVAGDTEIFTYFRTQLYSDVRQ